MRLCFGQWCIPWPGRNRTTTITGVPTTDALPLPEDYDYDNDSVSSAVDVLSAAEEPMTRALQPTDASSSADMAASVDAQDLKTLLEAKDTLIHNLETLLQARNNEIQELRSHLDMFQSVFPFSNPVSPTSTLHHPHHVAAPPVHQQSQNLVAKSLTSLLDGIARPRKQRAQGISAEPQSLSTIQELSQKKFPTYPKNDRYLATGESYRSLAYNFRISHSEISNIIKQVLSAICANLTPILLPQPTKTDFKARAVEFWERWNFPNCVGAIDGKHVRVVCPEKSGSLYYNYKNYFSIVLLAIVDAKSKFIAIDVGSYGKEGDSGIFSKSVMGKRIYSKQFGLPENTQLPGSDKSLPYIIVGDEAFRLHTHIMKPYNRSQAKEDFEKQIFNYRLSRARRVSENAFGLLSQIFRIYYTPIAIKPETCDLLITATCCLHNLIRDGYEERHIQQIEQEPIDTTHTNMLPLVRHGGYGNTEGFEVRDAFKSFFNEEGKLNWQNQIVFRT